MLIRRRGGTLELYRGGLSAEAKSRPGRRANRRSLLELGLLWRRDRRGLSPALGWFRPSCRWLFL